MKGTRLVQIQRHPLHPNACGDECPAYVTLPDDMGEPTHFCGLEKDPVPIWPNVRLLRTAECLAEADEGASE